MLSHAELVTHAEKWLRNSCGCGVVLTELVTVAYETPDAIGFRSGYSILVECKVNRQDFLKDAKKHFRIYPSDGVGSYRFYMCPEGVIKPEELPEKWGLIYVLPDGNRKRVVGPTGRNLWEPEFRFLEKNDNAERDMLVSALRRLQKGLKRMEEADEQA